MIDLTKVKSKSVKERLCRQALLDYCDKYPHIMEKFLDTLERKLNKKILTEYIT